MPRIPGTEQSKYRLLLLSLALLANLSICNQAELNQKKKLKTTRKETLHILEIVVGETIREKNKIPIQKWWWSTSGSVARTRSLCRRSSSGGGSMNAASEALYSPEGGKASSFEGWQLIVLRQLLLLQQILMPRAETTRQRAYRWSLGTAESPFLLEVQKERFVGDITSMSS